MRKPWVNALIVKLLGKKIGVGFMKKKLEGFWAKSSVITVADLGNEYFSVKFTRLEYLNLAIMGGPWIILGHYLADRRWEPGFVPEKANIHKVAAWIQLPGIPQEYFEFHFLNFIGNLIGKVLKVDKTTTIGDRGKFVRVCVLLDLSKPLKRKYEVEDNKMKIEYEGLYLICLHYRRYGHSNTTCPDLCRQPPPPNNPKVREMSPESALGVEQNYGVGL
ncbi:uncharacterized protein LOC133296898 [Gastrolobium bilobum]|uniref:uncharacterized protein LOC133296898 n=1 Tax=Gastrolobium bilobum TaxID=150636 RepID=UPI002AB00954|nr:uncharacterized protein LOC133296898 [Gastrolobium bilobum]